MTITYEEIAIRIFDEPESGLDPIDSISDLERPQIRAINDALDEIYSLQEWNFKVKNSEISTIIETKAYDMVMGIIKDNGIIISGEQFPLNEAVTPSKYYFDTTTGKPKKFWIEEEKINLWPTPDAVYDVLVKYTDIYPVVRTVESVDTYLAQFSLATDKLNVPARVEGAFTKALVYKSVLNIMVNPTEDTYNTYLAKYQDAIKVLQAIDSGTEKPPVQISITKG